MDCSKESSSDLNLCTRSVAQDRVQQQLQPKANQRARRCHRRTYREICMFFSTLSICEARVQEESSDVILHHRYHQDPTYLISSGRISSLEFHLLTSLHGQSLQTHHVIATMKVNAACLIPCTEAETTRTCNSFSRSLWRRSSSSIFRDSVAKSEYACGEDHTDMSVERQQLLRDARHVPGPVEPYSTQIPVQCWLP